MANARRDPIRVKGHAYRGVESNVYGDRRYVCECGDKGFPVRVEADAQEDHRKHKLVKRMSEARG